MTTEAPKILNMNLLQRILSSLALIPVVLGAVWVGGWPFVLLIVVIVGLGLVEWLRLTLPTPHGKLWAALAIPYLGGSGLALLVLRQVSVHGFALTLFLLLVVWGTDTGAYFAGRLIGGPKLLPQISPKKTWAGLIGGMVFAAAIGYGVAHGFGESYTCLAAVVGAVLAVVAQAGDFFESYVKRRAGAKDSGTLIPGHGGVLDRVDGLLFAAPVLVLIVWFLRLFGF